MQRINPTLDLPSEKYKKSFLEALVEFRTEGAYYNESKDRIWTIAELEKHFSEFIKGFEDERKGINLRAGWVPQTAYWIIDNGEYIGRVSVRHKLNEHLLHIGGHIGYDVRPSKRRMGYGTAALKLVLPLAKQLGIDKALVTCDATNEASRKIIRHVGGVLENEEPGEKPGDPNKLRFWIDL